MSRITLRHRWVLVICAGSVILLAPFSAGAQELVPAAYTPAPYGVNLLTLTSSYNTGDISFDPSLPIEDTDAEITKTFLGYTRTLNIAGRSANVGVMVPYAVGHLQGLLLGEPATADRSGLGDLQFRLGVNLYGARAMSPREFASFRPRVLVGASLVVVAPTGQYDPSKVINIGTNRWAFKPEVAVVYVKGRWAVDAYLGGWLYTDNNDFYGGVTREQDPILSTQFHLRHLFRPGLWAAVDANFWRGGQTTIGSVENDDLQNNSRVGATVSIRLGAKSSLRIAASSGAYTRIGGDFDSIGVTYGYSWTTAP